MRSLLMTVSVAIVLAACCCSDDPAVSNTGITGTWVRENNGTISVIALTKLDDRYLFRWKKYGRDDDFRVDCDWDGHCEEWQGGQKQADYRFTTRNDPASGRLEIECHETRLVPKVREQHSIDELSVEPGGKVLWSYTTERDGERFEAGKGPQRSFTKVADAVAYPPPRPRP